MPGIVVGVDGSPNSERALSWAMKEAAVRHAPLLVVAVQEVAKSYFTGAPVVMSVDVERLAETRQAVEEMAQQVAGQLDAAHPASVQVHAVSGFAAKELIDASQDADMVVVGSRGGGGFARLLLGSVSAQVIQHAACPVVVVPHQE